MKQRALNWLIAFDQFAFNTLTLGHSSPDETLSAAAWRWEQDGKFWGVVLRPLIDALFWFDQEHCRNAFESEKLGKHLPKVYQK